MLLVDAAGVVYSSGAGGVHASSSVGSGLDDLQPPPGVSWKKSKAKKKQVGCAAYLGQRGCTSLGLGVSFRGSWLQVLAGWVTAACKVNSTPC
jgi:hypothetical protein